MTGNQPPARRVVCYPRVMLAISIVVMVGLTSFALVMWFALPLSLRATFTPFQIITLLLVLVAIGIVLGSTSASVVIGDDQGLRIRNGLRRHRLRWADVATVDYRGGDPWAFVWVRPTETRPDGHRLMLLGIQRSDGLRAERAVDELRALRRQALS